MTQTTLDPQVLAEMLRAQQELLKQMQQEMAAMKRERLPDEKLSVTWLEWERQVLSRERSQEGARGDADQARTHRKAIMDLEFLHNGQVIRLADVPASSLTVTMINDWRSQLQLQKVTKGPKKGEPHAPSYRNRILNTLQSMLTWRYGKARNPLARIGRESTKDRGRQGYFHDEDHLEEWLSHANPQYQRIARVACGPGAMRISEARLLMEHEVTWDPEARKITLPGGRTKTGVGRDFSISPKNFEILQALREEATVCRYPQCEVTRNPKMAPNMREHRHLFAHQAYSDGRAPSLRTAVNWGTDAGKRADKAGMARLGPKKERASSHHLRHTGAVWNGFKSKGNLYKIMKDGGWTDVKVALGYAKRHEALLNEAAAAEEISMKEAVAERMRELHESSRQDPRHAPAPVPSVRRDDQKGGGR